MIFSCCICGKDANLGGKKGRGKRCKIYCRRHYELRRIP